MLNEMISHSCECPVYGRHHYYIPLDGWWCPYCGPSLSTITLRKVDDILERLAVIEESLPVERIPMINIDEIFDREFE